MQASSIVNRLKEVVGKSTDDFTDILGASSLTSSGNIATCTTTTNHDLVTGDYITIRGATNPITLPSLTRAGSIVTAIALEATTLVDPSRYDVNLRNSLTVTISGATPSDYNGTWQLLTVSDDRLTFTFKITETPITPATVAGFFLQSDFDGYNGYKQVTVLDATSFTYTIPTILNSPSQGNIEVSARTRIAWAATRERVDQFYESDESRQSERWMFVVMGSKAVYRDDTIASDISTSVNKNEDYFFEAAQDFSIFLYIPSQNEILGGFASDKAREYESFIVKSIANFSFDSELVDIIYQPTNYVGNEADDYNVAYYVHRYDFTAKGYIQKDDTIKIDPGVPLKLVDGVFKDKDLEFKPKFM